MELLLVLGSANLGTRSEKEALVPLNKERQNVESSQRKPKKKKVWGFLLDGDKRKRVHRERALGNATLSRI